MKSIYLFINRISQYYKRNKFIFIMFILGGILNAMIFAFFYGNMLPAIKNRNSQEIQYKTYSWNATASENPVESIKKIKESGLFESIVATYYINFEDKKSGETETEEYAVSFEGNPPINVSKGQLKIPTNDEIIVNGVSRANVGDKVTKYGIDFTVIGKHSDSQNYISYEKVNALPKETLMLSKVEAISKIRHDLNNDPAKTEIMKEFPNEEILAPTMAVKGDRNSSVFGMIVLCVGYAVSSLAFAFLFVFIMKSGSEENIVSIISGASGTRISLMVFWEGMIMVSVSSIIGLFLHWLLLPYFFNRININENTTYFISDYTIIFAVIFAIQAVIIFAFTKKTTKLSPVYARRELG